MQESHIESWEVHMSEKYMQYVEVKKTRSITITTNDTVQK